MYTHSEFYGRHLGCVGCAGANASMASEALIGRASFRGNRRRRARRFGATAAFDAGGFGSRSGTCSAAGTARGRARRCDGGIGGGACTSSLGTASGAAAADAGRGVHRDDRDGERGAERARGRALPQCGCANAKRAAPPPADRGETTRPAKRGGQAAARMTGMPSWRARSTRFSVMPLPGKAMTPLGRRSRSSSLRRNGAARPWRCQSGFTMT